MQKPTKPKTPELIAPKQAKSPTIPLFLLACGMIVTTCALGLSFMLNSLPASINKIFELIFLVLFLIDGWLVVIGGVWLLVLAIKKWTHKGIHPISAEPVKRLDLGLAWADSAVLAFYGIGSFFIYNVGQALINALLFGLAIAMIVFVVRK